jgi:glycosyltransferase involved in cell wall biosynthesis
MIKLTEDMADCPPVSVLLAVRNEQEYLDACLESIDLQDYPRDRIEIILIDGMSTDRTPAMIDDWSHRDPRVKSLQNAGKIVSTGMNIGLRHARHDLILWTSGHVILPPDYLRRCVRILNRTGAAAVGGVVHVASSAGVGKVTAAVLSSRFGVGLAPHRVATRSGWVSTVTMAIYRKEAILAVGGFNESLPRSQDNDLHDRMNRIGLKSYLDTDLRPIYMCRSTFAGFLGQAWTNGFWNVRLTLMGHRGFSLRHFVPMAFVGALFILSILSVITSISLYALLFVITIYAGCAAVFSIAAGMARGLSWRIVLLPLWFVSLHVTYGLASWVGFLRGKSK